MSPAFLPPARPRRQGLSVRPRERVARVGIRGSGKIELFDDLTGRKVREVPFENFVANPGLDRIRWMTRHAIGLGYGQETNEWEVGAGAGGYPEFWDLAVGDVWEGERADVFSHIVLNNDTAAEDAGTEYAPKLHTAPVIAWANRDGYAGADTKRGTINFSEVRRDADRIILVFDWPTSSGNGTFRSIQFCRIDESTLLALTDSVAADSITLSGVSSNAGGAVDAGDGDHLWVTDRNNTTAGSPSIRKLLYADGSLVDSILYSELGSMRAAGIGLDVVSGDLWVEQDNAQGDSIKRVTTAGSIVTTLTIPSPMDANHRGLAYGDGKLYLGAYMGSSVYRVAILNQTTGAVIDSVDLATAETTLTDFGGVFYDETKGKLYAVLSAADTISCYELDPDTLDITNTFQLSPGNGASLVFRSGTGLLDYLNWLIPSSSAVPAYKMPFDTLGSRSLLGAEVSKTALQTMKITYQFDFE